jgi:hypothetical protein
MRLTTWCALIAVPVGMGFLRVSQRNALLLHGYAVGERMERVHAQETVVSWLHADVVGLTSPTRLAEVAKERRLNFVAWSMLPAAPSASGAIRAASSSGNGGVPPRAGDAEPLASLASLDPLGRGERNEVAD